MSCVAGRAAPLDALRRVAALDASKPSAQHGHPRGCSLGCCVALSAFRSWTLALVIHHKLPVGGHG
eukprot:6711674-Prymnesium_polylepis.1